MLHQSGYNYNVFDVLSVVLRVTYIQCLAPKDYRLWLPLSVRKPQMLSVDSCAIHSGKELCIMNQTAHACYNILC